MKRYELLGVHIEDLDDQELKQLLLAWLNESTVHVIVTPNPEFLLQANKNPKFKFLLNKSDLSIPDGVGLRFGIAALTNEKLLHRHTGVDLVVTLAQLSQSQKTRVLLVGGAPTCADKTKKHLLELYPNLNIESIDPGHISGGLEDISIEDTLISQIQASNPDILIVALGQGKQEKFIDQIKFKIPTLRIAVGVGGSFETLSGMTPRAPLWMQKTGLEWLWRVTLEPKRIRRILNAVIIFPAVIVWSTLKQRKFIRACKNVFPEIYHQIKGL